MKSLLLTLSLFAAEPALADVRTQDNVNYLVLLTDQARSTPESFSACVQDIRAVADETGLGVLNVFNRFGIVVANLSSNGADQVGQFECVRNIRPEGVMHGNPRIGRGN